MSNLLKKNLFNFSDDNKLNLVIDNTFIKNMKNEESQNPFQNLINSSNKTTTNPTTENLNQFYKIYTNRLQYFRPKIKEDAIEKFPSKSTFYNKILDIQPTNLSQSIKKNQEVNSIDPETFCWAIGTIYTEMKYKPDILNQVSEDLYGLPERPNNYVYKEGNDESEDANKEIMFEDESGRIILQFDHTNIEKEILVTGVVVGILGYVDINNDLQVIDYCFPPKLQPPLVGNLKQENSKILLISGLDLSQDTNIEKLTTLQSYLSGAINHNCNYESNNLIILGDSLLSYNNLAMFNEFLSTVIRAKTITLIPSLNDPSDRLFPQRPINLKLFDRLLQLNSNDVLSLQTNPTYWNSFKVFLEAGDTINDIVKYSDYNNDSDRLEIMKNFIKWQNLAPTAPDTLSIQPFDINEIDDPFVLKQEYPRAIIFGNQPSFLKTSYENVELIGVPKFATTNQLLELDLNSFKYKLIQL